MKHGFFAIAFLALLCGMTFVGCEKEETYNTIITIRGGGNEKTQYNNANGSVTWEEDEEISVVRGNSSPSNPFSTFLFNGMVDGAATFRGNIPEEITSGNYYAIYPAQEGLSIDNGMLSCEVIQTQQTLCEGTFGSGNNTAVGYNSSTTMRFRNVGGLAKLALRGSARVQSVKIIDNTTGHFLSGRGTLNVLHDSLPIEWSEAHSLNYVVANAPTGGLSVDGGVVFYLVLPPCTMTDYTLVVTDTDGHENRINCSTSVTITRAHVTMLGAFEIHGGPYDNQFWYSAPSQLEGFEIGTSVWGMTVTNHVFDDGQGVVSFDSPILEVPDAAFMNRDLISIELPASDTVIGESSFAYCANLRSVRMDYVKTVGQAAFHSCTNLSSVQMSRVKSIGFGSFAYCKRLKSVNCPHLTILEIGAFSGCDSLATAYMPNVVTIGGNAFNGCKLLSSVTITNATTIGMQAFSFCQSLTSVDMPNVMTIGIYAFSSENGIGLTTVSLPKVKTIGESAFLNCPLTEATLGSQLESVGRMAFYDCRQLDNVYCYAATVPVLETDVFANVPSTAVLHVPAGMGDDYAADPDWSAVFGTTYGTGMRIEEDL